MKLHSVLLFSILLVAVVLRFYNLGSVPVGFHGDEASIGYNAYSLLKTARDQNGQLLPLSIDQFGDFRPSGYHFAAIAPVALLGLTEFATRAPAALFGSLSVIIFYFLVKELFANSQSPMTNDQRGKKTLIENSRSVALLSAMLLAISPWHIIASRATSESIIAMFFVLLGTYATVVAFTSPSKATRYLILGGASYIASFFFYHAARFFVPAFVVAIYYLLWAFRKRLPGMKKSIALTLVALFGAFFFFIVSSRGISRPFTISIFNSPEATLVLNEQIREDGGQNVWLTRILHNKPVAYGRIFLTNYLKHFSGDFLFLKGGVPPRYIVPWTGFLYPIELVFLVIGFSLLVSKVFMSKQPIFAVPLVWVLLGPVPAALTFEDIPNVQRSIMMLPGLLMVVSYGIASLSNLIRHANRRLALLVIILLIYTYSTGTFLHNYFHHAFTHQPWYRNAGEKELAYALKGLISENKKVISTAHGDNNIIFYLFYWNVDPSYYQKIGSPRDRDGLVFGGITFANRDCPLEAESGAIVRKDTAKISEQEVIEEGVYYVNKGECKVSEYANVVRSIQRPDNSVAFRILTLDPSYGFLKQ